MVEHNSTGIVRVRTRQATIRPGHRPGVPVHSASARTRNRLLPAPPRVRSGPRYRVRRGRGRGRRGSSRPARRRARCGVASHAGATGSGPCLRGGRAAGGRRGAGPRRLVCVAPQLDPRLRDQALGSWQGRPWAEIAAAEPDAVRDFFQGFAEGRPGRPDSGGEPLGAAVERALAWWGEQSKEAAGQTLCVVTAANILAGFVAAMLGMRLDRSLRPAAAGRRGRCARRVRQRGADRRVECRCARWRGDPMRTGADRAA